MLGTGQQHLAGVAAALLSLGATAAGQTASDFFDPSVLHEIRLTVHEQDWKTLRERYTENIYFPCEFEWRGVFAYDAGVRSRGYGSRNPVKPGLKVDFDRYAPNQTFLGLKSVHLKNAAQDPSMLKERLSMELFRRMGLPAPRVAHARVYINERYAGVFVVVESIDKRFLTRNFGENDGYLYQYEWDGPYNFDYRGSDPALYIPVPFKPETHEKDPDPLPLVEFIRTLNQTTDAEFPDALAGLVDLRVYLTQVAIESFLGEMDGIVGDSGLANFYWYRFEGKNWWQFLVWDKDNTFHDPERPILKNADTNVLMKRTVAVPELRAAYLEALAKTLAAAGGEDGWLEQEIPRQAEQIRGAVYEDPLRQCSREIFGPIGPCTNEDFERVVAYMAKYTRERREFIRRELEAAGYVWPEVAR